jgi:hypothetical protein
LVSHTKGEIQIQDVSEQGAEKKYLDLRRRKWKEARKDSIMRSFITSKKKINETGNITQRNL